nr:MAG TPA: hypothetical protein [Caudoviricetes sp.]
MALNLFTAGGVDLPSNGRQGSVLTKTNNDDSSWEANEGIQYWYIGTDTDSSSAPQWIASELLSKLKTASSGFKFVYAYFRGQIWHSIVMNTRSSGNVVYATILIFNYGQTGFYKYTIESNTLSSPKYFS